MESNKELSFEDYDFSLLEEVARQISKKVLVAMGHRHAEWRGRQNDHTHETQTTGCQCCADKFTLQLDSALYNTWSLRNDEADALVVCFYMTKQDIENFQANQPVEVDSLLSFVKHHAMNVCLRVRSFV